MVLRSSIDPIRFEIRESSSRLPVGAASTPRVGCGTTSLTTGTARWACEFEILWSSYYHPFPGIVDFGTCDDPHSVSYP